MSLPAAPSGGERGALTWRCAPGSTWQPGPAGPAQRPCRSLPCWRTCLLRSQRPPRPACSRLLPSSAAHPAPCRALRRALCSVLELAGVQNVLAKRLGSRSQLNNARVAIKALQQLRTLEEVAAQRQLPLSYLMQ